MKKGNIKIKVGFIFQVSIISIHLFEVAFEIDRTQCATFCKWGIFTGCLCWKASCMTASSLLFRLALAPLRHLKNEEEDH